MITRKILEYNIGEATIIFMFQTSTTTINLGLRRTLSRSVILIINGTNNPYSFHFFLIQQFQFRIGVAQIFKWLRHTRSEQNESYLFDFHHNTKHRWFVPHHDKQKTLLIFKFTIV